MKKLFLTLVLAISAISTQAFAWDQYGSYGYGGYNTSPQGIAGMIGSVFGANGSSDPYNRRSTDYSRTETMRKSAQVEDGVILMVRKVTQESSNAASAVGTTAGAAVGGVLGAQMGGNTAINTVGGIVGSVVGGMLGQQAGHYASETTSGELLVRLSNGEKVVVVQEDGLQYRPGQKVFLFSTQQGNVRVAPNTADMSASGM